MNSPAELRHNGSPSSDVPVVCATMSAALPLSHISVISVTASARPFTGIVASSSTRCSACSTLAQSNGPASLSTLKSTPSVTGIVGTMRCSMPVVLFVVKARSSTPMPTPSA
jgi:hypothetical protein